MPKTDDMVYESFSTRRMEGLTDGVFAIAMTLLILDIKVDNFGTIASSADLIHMLTAKSTELSSFVISFLLLGSMWAVHMRQFEYIKRADRHLTMINTLRLLVVVFMPLTTSIGSAYPDVELARMLLPLNFLCLALVSIWQWNYAFNNKNLSNKIPEHIKQQAKHRNIMIILTASVVVILSIFIGLWAFILFIFDPIYSAALHRLYKARAS